MFSKIGIQLWVRLSFGVKWQPNWTLRNLRGRPRKNRLLAFRRITEFLEIFTVTWLVYSIGKSRIYLARSAISPKFSDDMKGRSRTKKIVYFRVNFKLFRFRFFYWLMAKYLKSDSTIENYAVSKIPHRKLISNLSKHAVVPRNFSQKYNRMWSPDHYPCLALGLLF